MRASRWRLRGRRTADGEESYVLHNPGADAYVEIDARNYFLWELMDGKHTLADLAMAYFAKFGALLNRNPLLELDGYGGPHGRME
jgi:hypothetical protein